MEIEIRYLKTTDAEPRFMELTPEEYFDPLEEDQTFEANGIPKFNFAEEYLDPNPDQL
jgi:hypothetical protein